MPSIGKSAHERVVGPLGQGGKPPAPAGEALRRRERIHVALHAETTRGPAQIWQRRLAAAAARPARSGSPARWGNRASKL